MKIHLCVFLNKQTCHLGKLDAKNFWVWGQKYILKLWERFFGLIEAPLCCQLWVRFHLQCKCNNVKTLHDLLSACLFRARCWLRPRSFGLMWVAYFLSLLQHLLQSFFLGHFPLLLQNTSNFWTKDCWKKKPTCYEQDTGHASSKYLPSVICSWLPLSFILQSQR